MAVAPSSVAADAASHEAGASAPVVLVIFDGLPAVSLLDESGGIDSVFHPNFAELARRSTRFTGITTVGDSIRVSVPAILSGRLPREEIVLAIVDEHRETLFSMLADDYEFNVVESETVLRDDSRSRAQHESKLRSMYDDRDKNLSEAASFRLFVRQIRPTLNRAARKQRGSLHFVHVRIPRVPLHLSPEGVSYRPYRTYAPPGGAWPDEPWWSEEAWRRHLLQLRFVDALLGELMATLRELEIFDQALVVVTADYGRSFWPGESGWTVGSPGHPEDILRVPLLVKRPGQTGGTVDPRPGQTIDILPTIADGIGREVGFEVDGCSLFDSGCAPPAERRIQLSDAHGGRRWEMFPLDLTARTATLERKLARIGSGREPARVHAFGPHASLVGRRIDSLEVVGPAVGVADPNRQWARAGRGATGPRVAMQLHLDTEPPPDEPLQVAVARAGLIETVVPAPLTWRGRRLLVAMIPVAPEVAPEAPLELYVVEGSLDAVRLRPITIRSKPAPKRAPKRGG